MPTETVATFTPVELAALRGDLMVVVPVTVAKDAAAGTKVAGLALGIITASGKAAAYDNNAVDGTETCVGFLLQEVDVTNSDVSAGLVISGFLNESKLTGLDAAGKTDIGAISMPGGILKF